MFVPLVGVVGFVPLVGVVVFVPLVGVVVFVPLVGVVGFVPLVVPFVGELLNNFISKFLSVINIFDFEDSVILLSLIFFLSSNTDTLIKPKKMKILKKNFLVFIYKKLINSNFYIYFFI